MIVIKNVKTIHGDMITHQMESHLNTVIDAKGVLTLLPGLIDPHVHFRVPGAEHKEDWMTAAKAAIKGGVTTVFDMPNNTPSCISLERLRQKMQQIDAQLKHVDIPLNYKLYLGADKNHFDEIAKCKNHIAGIKVFMGSSTGELLMDDDEALEVVFKKAAEHDLLVAVHAEDEDILKEMKNKYRDVKDPSVHSKIRDRKAVAVAASKAIALAEKYKVRLYILHISTEDEIEIIRKAKQRGVQVFAETTPHHLFLTEDDYGFWGTRVQINPPVRTLKDQEALWQAIAEGVIDTIGTDHAPHTLAEKSQPYGLAPSGIPGIETVLPLLLDAYHGKKISLKKIIELTKVNIEKMFRLKSHQDVVLVDLEKEVTVADKQMQTKCGWSPYSGRTLKGWPEYTIVNGRVFCLNEV